MEIIELVQKLFKFNKIASGVMIIISTSMILAGVIMEAIKFQKTNVVKETGMDLLIKSIGYNFFIIIIELMYNYIIM